MDDLIRIGRTEEGDVTITIKREVVIEFAKCMFSLLSKVRLC